ncbi:MAG: RNA-binding protein [Gammaproteobacteria bacterium]|nr:MAG: RNA-binding protein [Gammaproteobacteria bacterium]
MKKMFVGGLPLDSTEESVSELFSAYGTVRSIKLAADVFSGQCKGFGFVEMEGHEARAAIAGLNGKIIGEKSLKVQFEEPRKGGKRGGRRR